jgi:hypothetical protein
MLGRLIGSQDRTIGQATMWGSFWPGDNQVQGTSIPVTRQTALQLLAVYGSVQLIVNEISTLPIDTGSRWVNNPTPDLDTAGWLSQILTSLLLDGTAYLRVYRSEALGVTGMLPLDPQIVGIQRVNGRKSFLIHGIPVGFEIIEIPALMLPGTERGLSPVEFARQSIGLGLSAQQYGVDYFDGPGNMPGVIESTEDHSAEHQDGHSEPLASQKLAIRQRAPRDPRRRRDLEANRCHQRTSPVPRDPRVHRGRDRRPTVHGRPLRAWHPRLRHLVDIREPCTAEHAQDHVHVYAVDPPHRERDPPVHQGRVRVRR